MVWCYFYGLENDGAMITPIDLPVIPFTNIQAEIANVQICGASENIQDELIDNTVVTLIRNEDLFDLVALTELIQNTDMAACEGAIGSAFLDMLQGWYFD